MRHKEFVTELSLSRLNMRKLGVLYFVPHAVLFLLIPLMGGGYLLYHGFGENAYFLIFCDFQKFIPFMGCWWILFGLSDYVEGKASELVRTYKKSVLWDFVILFAWYLLHVVLLFVLGSVLVDNYWPDFPLIFIQTALFVSVAFFLMLATRTVLAPFLAVLFYEIFAILSNFSVMEYVNIFSLMRIESPSQLLLPYLPLFVVSILLVIFGNKFYQKGN